MMMIAVCYVMLCRPNAMIWYWSINIPKLAGCCWIFAAFWQAVLAAAAVKSCPATRQGVWRRLLNSTFIETPFHCVIYGKNVTGERALCNVTTTQRHHYTQHTKLAFIVFLSGFPIFNALPPMTNLPYSKFIDSPVLYCTVGKMPFWEAALFPQRLK